MGAFSLWHWIVLLLVVILIFGTKKLKDIGSDLGAAMKNFKSAVKDDDAGVPDTARPATVPTPVNAIEYKPMTPTPSATPTQSAAIAETPPAPAQMVYVEPQPESESPVRASNKLKRPASPKTAHAATPKRPVKGTQPKQRTAGRAARSAGARKA